MKIKRPKLRRRVTYSPAKRNKQIARQEARAFAWKLKGLF